MTFWAKLLIVVVFILSLIFASMSVVLFGKREDFRAQLEKTKRDYAQDKEKWTQDNAKLTEKVSQLGTDLDQANSAVAAGELRINTLVHDNERKDADVRARDIDLQKQEDLRLEDAAAIAKLTTEATDLFAENKGLKTENNSLIGKLSDSEARANKLEKDNEDLTASLTEKTADLAKAQDTIKLNDAIFAELSRRNVAWQELINKWSTLPEIKAKVLMTNKESNFVILNVGEKQGVKNNYEFTIFRDGTFVAKVNVFNVQDNLCAARIVMSKLPVQTGDNAWTRLAD